jgi:hypothetical protein
MVVSEDVKRSAIMTMDGNTIEVEECVIDFNGAFSASKYL